MLELDGTSYENQIFSDVTARQNGFGLLNNQFETLIKPPPPKLNKKYIIQYN